ncbi:MAG TPA: phage tail protein [Methylophilaceae bacterium]|nr:phage tail protein [Methylophilaceae bacterium]
MSTLDKVSLLIDGHVHQAWEDYDIESDLLTPSDAWSVELAVNSKPLPAFVKPWSQVTIKIGNDTVLVGRVDEISENVDKKSHSLTMCGRDNASILVDCAAPIFTARLVSLQDIMAKVVKPLGITKFRVDAAATRTREKVNVEPGDRAWDALQNAAEANGLWPWFTPDGVLVVGGPDYDAEPVATIVMRKDGKGNNAQSMTRRVNVSNQFSEYTVLGQTHGTDTELGKNSLKATARDESVGWYRPNLTVDHESDSTAVCRDRARKLLSDSRLSAFDLDVLVKGHRIKDGGALWTPGQRVQIINETLEIEGIFFLMSRRFKGGREGTRTYLKFKEDGLWTLDAHPHKRKHRRGKNNAPGAIVDVSADQ